MQCSYGVHGVSWFSGLGFRGSGFVWGLGSIGV